MRIAVIGAGAIGSLVAGYLKLKGQDVFLAGRNDSVNAIRENGLKISGVRNNFGISIAASERLSGNYGLVILAVKTQDVEQALKQNQRFIEGARILTTQNGICADNIVSKYAPKEKIISSIVMFGATYLEPGKVAHNFEGNWIMGSLSGESNAELAGISGLLNNIFPTIVSEDIRGMKYLKLFINANNCIPAILGKSMQEAFSDVDISRISIAIWKEGLDIVSRLGINLVSLPDFPVERLNRLTSMPINEAAKVFSGIMANLSKEPLYGSILQSIKRGKTSEIDYINGEFVSIAGENSLRAPLNEKLVEMVHQVEKTGRFFSKEELLSEIKNIM